MSEFPKFLHHPSYRPGTINVQGLIDQAEGGGRVLAPGAATLYPPVVVNNAAQEAEYVSKGYSPAPYSQAAIDQQMTAPTPAGYREQTYPMYGANGEIIADPNPQPAGLDPKEWPKWVEGVICKTPEEEKAVYADLGMPDPKMAEYEDAVARVAALAKALGIKGLDAPTAPAGEARGASRHEPVKRSGGGPKDRQTPEQAELIALCTEAGIKVDTRYSVKRLREMLDAATAPKETDDAGKDHGEERQKGTAAAVWAD